MKTNKIYIIGAIILVFGIFLFAVGFSMTGFDIAKLDTEGTYEEKTYQSNENIKSITINDSNTDVKVIVSADNKLHMTYYENENAYYEISEDNNTLSVEKKNNFKWYNNLFNFKFEKTTLLLTVPADFDGELSVKTSNNSITVIDLNTEEMLLRSSNGKIEVENVKVAGLLDTNTSNSSIYISDSAITGDVVCRTSNGKIELEKVECGNAKAESSNSGITITSVTSKGRIEAQSSNGRIEIDEIEFGTDLTLITSNNSIKGEISGKLADYSVSSRTSNAKNNLPENLKSGDKNITVTTSNGAIDIEFSED
ncbi:MAG: DUF4097 family beta strand repeat-containing protein [Eubacteriales bacterium]